MYDECVVIWFIIGWVVVVGLSWWLQNCCLQSFRVHGGMIFLNKLLWSKWVISSENCILRQNKFVKMIILGLIDNLILLRGILWYFCIFDDWNYPHIMASTFSFYIKKIISREALQDYQNQVRRKYHNTYNDLISIKTIFI